MYFETLEHSYYSKLVNLLPNLGPLFKKLYNRSDANLHAPKTFFLIFKDFKVIFDFKEYLFVFFIMNIWHYLLLIIAKFIVDSNQCNSNALKCYECHICESGVDAMCGEKHNFKVCKCRPGELGLLKTCENTEGRVDHVEAIHDDLLTR